MVANFVGMNGGQVWGVEAKQFEATKSLHKRMLDTQKIWLTNSLKFAMRVSEVTNTGHTHVMEHTHAMEHDLYSKHRPSLSKKCQDLKYGLPFLAHI